MGFLDFLFGKKKEEVKVDKIKILAPIDGKVIPLSQVPDETFAQGLLGLGVGIEPSGSGIVKAPVSGTVIQLFETKHAFVIETAEGLQVLTHFGLNTVKLKGEGFEAIAKEGDNVKAGDSIVKYDLEFLKANADSVTTPVVVLESDDYPNVTAIFEGDGVAGVTEIILASK